ncbi:MAG: hypothetical protein PHX34_02660 [Candidatus Shapirobacteria bacterium]|nr:hypothetical protein [Candidatus Shapirobacteria bacterium]
MEQHSIPQQISSYEFKLVGEMTLKQFLKAAVGIILALLINATKLIVIVKWPLMILCGGCGLLLAFVPFEDRPLEVWIMAFIKSIYSPTIYVYKKKADKNWLDLDLTKINTSKPLVLNKAEIKTENQEKTKLRDFFQVVSLRHKTIDKNEMDKTDSKIDIKNVKTDDVIQNQKPDVLDSTKTKVEVEVKTNDWRDEKANLGLKSEKLEATGKVLFGSIPMPDIPELPNVIVGMATSNEGKIVDGVIVEIQDEHGNPSRVLKTNSLGQFKISTPLSNGRYLIIAEKNGYIFDRVNLDLNGQIVEPIRIIAHN